jgi:hypothetical protein
MRNAKVVLDSPGASSVGAVFAGIVIADFHDQRTLRAARHRHTRDCRHTSLAVRPLMSRARRGTLPAARCGHRRPAEAAYRARKDALTEPRPCQPANQHRRGLVA